jgi:NAD-dependent dihydropyrimidine dehydrogenase PreA subunit
MVMKDMYRENSLRLDGALCNGCRMCVEVCPHAVFDMLGKEAILADPASCMECGACRTNCATGAITVDSGVGCAAAMMIQSVTGRKEASCGCS